MDELERQLKSLRPTSVSADEADVMYRCGWNAALASQDRLVTKCQGLSSDWFKPFVSGVAATAACWIVVLLIQGGSQVSEADLRTANLGLVDGSAASEGTQPEHQQTAVTRTHSIPHAVDADSDSVANTNRPTNRSVDADEIGLAMASLQEFVSSVADRIPKTHPSDPIRWEAKKSVEQPKLSAASQGPSPTMSLLSSRNASFVAGLISPN